MYASSVLNYIYIYTQGGTLKVWFMLTSTTDVICQMIMHVLDKYNFHTYDFF